MHNCSCLGPWFGIIEDGQHLEVLVKSVLELLLELAPLVSIL